jgi:hypothetical protein
MSTKGNNNSKVNKSRQYVRLNTKVKKVEIINEGFTA